MYDCWCKVSALLSVLGSSVFQTLLPPHNLFSSLFTLSLEYSSFCQHPSLSGYPNFHFHIIMNEGERRERKKFYKSLKILVMTKSVRISSLHILQRVVFKSYQIYDSHSRLSFPQLCGMFVVKQTIFISSYFIVTLVIKYNNKCKMYYIK